MRPFIVYDQFEEGFAIGQATAGSRQLHSETLVQLADLIECRVPESVERRFESQPEVVEDFELDRHDHRVMFCLRKDCLAQLEDLVSLMPSISENRMRIARMNGQQAVEAVRLPGGHLIREDVSEQVVRFVAGDESMGQVHPSKSQQPPETLKALQVEPALLSLFCQQLNNRRISQGQSHVTQDLFAGSREHILNDFYRQCFHNLPAGVQRLIKDELLTDSGYRESIALERITRELVQQGIAAEAIDTLVQRRLLHIEMRGNVRRVELTHDVLTDVVSRSRAERQKIESDQAARARKESLQREFRAGRRKFVVAVAAMAAGLLLVRAFSVLALC